MTVTDIRIKEHSWIAKWAAKRLGFNRVAVVIGHTIHLYNTSRADFIGNGRWLKHELKHVEQFRQYGFLGFLVRYLAEYIRNGYYRNKFEVEARKAELEANPALKYRILTNVN